jgi:HD-like signal output (HDOD) protein
MSAVSDTSTSARQIVESIASLPPLPATAQEILTCFGDEFIDADKVTAVVEGDPGICGKLLGLANSAYFGLPQPVTSMSEAISRVLGVDTVRSLVLAMAIQQSFNSRKCPAFDSERFWIQSLLTAECCKKIVAGDEIATDTVRDLAYSTGLCHNLGLMALAHMEPKRTNIVLRLHREQAQPESLAQLFIDEFSTDHKIMTAELARFWSLPEAMITAYSYRASPVGECSERLAAVIVAGATAVGNTEFEEEHRLDIAPWASAFGLSTAELQKMAVFSERQQERVRSLASNMN